MLILMKNKYDGGSILGEAEDVYISKKINESNTLSFKMPISAADKISVSRRIKCEKEIYVVESVSCDNDNKTISVSCTHEFIYIAKRLHIPLFASTDTVDFIGVDVDVVLSGLHNKLCEIMGDYGYRLLLPHECSALGFEPLEGKIDYEAEDKVTLWTVLENIISFSGHGEIYFSSDNGEGYKNCYGIVKRIGIDTDITFSTSTNMNNVSVDYDISDMITMLWPYGDNDMDIVNAPQNTDGLPYIISPNAELYGKICGYKSYKISDLTEAGPEKLFNRAVWEFDIANPDRIDVPSINITGTVTDIGIPEGICLGDTVNVIDNGRVIRERIISIKKYPYSGDPSEVSIGRVKRDMFFYLNQVGIFTQRYKNISARNGKIFGSKVTGTVKTNAISAEEAVSLLNPTGQIVIDSNGIRILSGDGAFFNVNKNELEVGNAITVSNAKATANLSELKLNGLAFTTDDDGNLYYNGKKVQLISEEE